jgi:transposase InsO family protein
LLPIAPVHSWQLSAAVGHDLRGEPGRFRTKLVGDITYVRTWAGWLYLATAIDCATRKVVGWSMADHMRASLVVDALTMAAGRSASWTPSTLCAWASAASTRSAAASVDEPGAPCVAAGTPAAKPSAQRRRSITRINSSYISGSPPSMASVTQRSR